MRAEGTDREHKDQRRVTESAQAAPEMEPQQELAEDKKIPDVKDQPFGGPAGDQQAELIGNDLQQRVELRDLPFIRDQPVAPQHTLHHGIVKPLVGDTDAVRQPQQDKPEHRQKRGRGDKIFSVFLFQQACSRLLFLCQCASPSVWMYLL